MGRTTEAGLLIGVAIAGANRNDHLLMGDTLDGLSRAALTLHDAGKHRPDRRY